MACSIACIIPREGSILPSKASSPINMQFCMFCGKICLEMAKIAIEIGKSREVPDFSSSAGARFMSSFCFGKLKPELAMAERIRSRLSLIVLLAIPTILNAGRPRLRSASMVIS